MCVGTGSRPVPEVRPLFTIVPAKGTVPEVMGIPALNGRNAREGRRRIAARQSGSGVRSRLFGVILTETPKDL
jgi:hypothetical protein